MSEEVKEILEEIDNKIIPNEHWNKIKDYITNLQNKYENQIHRYMNLKDYATNLQKENEELKDQRKKAIKYIKSTNFYGIRSGKTLFSKNMNELLNILGGEEDF